MHEVAALWGRRLLQSRSIFLAGSDVLHLPAEDVLGYLEATNRAFPIGPARGDPVVERAAERDEAASRLDGVHVFLDDFALEARPRSPGANSPRRDSSA